MKFYQVSQYLAALCPNLAKSRCAITVLLFDRIANNLAYVMPNLIIFEMVPHLSKSIENFSRTFKYKYSTQHHKLTSGFEKRLIFQKFIDILMNMELGIIILKSPWHLNKLFL